MFGFFKRKKTEEDPLSDLKTVSRWMQDLPAGDIYTAQEQVVQSLIQFNHAGLPMSKERLQVLMHLDEQAREMQHSLCSQYLRNPRMSKVIESRLWTAIHAFYWETTRGYHTFLMDFVGNPGGSKIQPAMPQLAARAIRGFGDIFKWRYFRYEKVEEKLWQRVHNIYRIAEFDDFQHNRFKAYVTDTKQSSCMEEYLRVLLLSPLGSGSLTPRQVEMVDHWLDNWSELPRLDRDYDADRHYFFVDTGMGLGMKRLRARFTAENSYRYVDIDRLLAFVIDTKQALKSGALPASLGLGEDFRLPDGYDLLDHVANELAATSERERRLNPREAAEGRCEVIRDFATICTHMREEVMIASGSQPNQVLTPEEILDIKLYGFVTERTKSAISQRSQGTRDIASDHWPLHDRSDKGIGILLKNEDSEWVRVSKLLALRTDPAATWLIGVIRRITRLEQDIRKIGVETIDGQPLVVQLETHEHSLSLSYTVDDTGYDNQPPSQALIFPKREEDNRIIMESARYAHGRKFHMRDLDRTHLIRLENVLDKGDGWLMAKYTLVT